MVWLDVFVAKMISSSNKNREDEPFVVQMDEEDDTVSRFVNAIS